MIGAVRVRAMAIGASLVVGLTVGAGRIGSADGPCGAAVVVPAGEFAMGTDEAEPDSAPDERPRHTVVLDGYEIDTFEVTNRCYAAFIAAGTYESPARWSQEGWAWRVAAGATQPAFWDDPAFRAPDRPVVGVSWYEAEAYCRWRGRRLPTEAQWEKAARGADGRRYPWGPEWAPNRANGDAVVGRLTAVGSYPAGASPYGAHDMAGNVWEWVQDWYRRDYYQESPSANPPGPAEGTTRVLRGGSWNFPPRHIRTAARTHLPPETGIRYLGFRCARSR